MPIPGGVLALQQSLSFYPAVQREPRRRSNSLVPTDPAILAFNERQRYLEENLKCTIAFYKEVLPSNLGKFTGVLVLEAKEEIVHSGLFILMKGLSLPPKRRQVVKSPIGTPVRKPVTSLKFTVLGNTCGSRRGSDATGEIVIERGTRESYPLELEFPESSEELPPPLITSEGKLMYRFQAFMSTSKGRHVKVGETSLQYQGYYNLLQNENDADATDKPIRIQQELQCKRSYLGLGKKKVVNWDFSVTSNRYLQHEGIDFTLAAKSQDKMLLEGRVELIQKVWHQVPAQLGRRLSVKMKVNIVSFVKMEKLEVGNEDEDQPAFWHGMIVIPKGMSPTYKFDFMNSINYILRVTVGVAGENDSAVSSESPIIIGTIRETIPSEKDSVDGEVDGAMGGTCAVGDESPQSGAVTPVKSMSNSQSLTFLPCRPRASSFTSVQSYQSQISGISRSSTPSIFKMPPNYSQLSSRRPTLDTLPPPYCELEVLEQSLLQTEGEQEYKYREENNIDAVPEITKEETN